MTSPKQDFRPFPFRPFPLGKKQWERPGLL